MGSLGKSVFRIGAALMFLSSIIMFAPAALANAKPPAPPAKQENCVPTGGVKINGGSVTNTTNLDLTADGGTAIGDATGGDDNVALTTGASDEDQTAAAGNGGTADAGANGGAIAAENVNSGDNSGNAISVGNTYAAGCAPLDSNGNPIMVSAVEIDGGTVVNETNINVSADGGTAIADASGGDNNIAINNGSAGSAGNGGISASGNGGTANSSANGGAISLGDINSGSNSGNTISVGNTISGGVPIPGKPVPGKPVPGKPVPGKPIGKTPAPPRELPSALPDTGTGSLVQGEATLPMLALVVAAATVFAAAAGQQALRGRGR
jgi:hypothetical protein